MHARPGETGPADADAVAHCPPLALHQIEHSLMRIDDDGARWLGRIVLDLLSQKSGIDHELSGLGRRFHHSWTKIGRIRR